MTSEERFAPESSLVDEYLKAAAADHQGHKILDLAVWYAIIQNYVNRAHIQFLGQPFRVHFFVVATSTFGKSSSLDFGFTKFLGGYQKMMNQELDPRFIDLSGQNTAAGLMDAFNDASDAYKYQILTAWIDEVTNIFPRFMNRRDQDIANLLANVLFGRRDVRHVRERGSKKQDSVDRPVINACFPATPDQYVDLMKGASSSDILRRFILLAPTEGDGRDATPFTRYRLKLDRALELFGQWLNLIDVHSGTPTSPSEVLLHKDAYEQSNELFASKAGSVCATQEKAFFASKQNSTLFLAALNAMSRSCFEVTCDDVTLAWNLLNFSWRGFLELEKEQPMADALTPKQKQRKIVIERISEVVAAAGKQGIPRRDIQARTWALRHFSTEEADEIFGYLETEIKEVFCLPLDIPYADGRKHSKRLYFSRLVWSPEEAVAVLPLSKPTWSSAQKSFVDALGNTHAELKDCIGYRPDWEPAVGSASLAS